MVFTGYIIGSLLGRLVAYGTLLGAMEKRGLRLASLSTPQARSAVAGARRGVRLRSLDHNDALSLVGVLVDHLGVWVRSYPLSGPMGIIHAGDLGHLPRSFLRGGLDALRVFNKRIDQLYGGAQAREALDLQLKEAQEDRRKLTTSLEGSGPSSDVIELDNFIRDISDRRNRSWFLNPRILGALIIWNALLFLFPLTWSLASAGVILNGKQYVGIHVGAIVAGSAASLAGIRAGDIITEINGQPVGNADFPFMQRVVSASAGRPLHFQIQRGRDHIRVASYPAPLQRQSGNWCAGSHPKCGAIKSTGNRIRHRGFGWLCYA